MYNDEKQSFKYKIYFKNIKNKFKIFNFLNKILFYKILKNVVKKLLLDVLKNGYILIFFIIKWRYLAIISIFWIFRYLADNFDIRTCEKILSRFF